MGIHPLRAEPQTAHAKIEQSTPRSWIRPSVLGYLYLIYALIAFFFPPELYKSLMGEPYFAARNLRMLFFAIGCVLCLQIGIAFANIRRTNQISRAVISVSREQARRKSLIVVGIVVICVNLASAFFLFQQNYNNIVSAIFLGEQTGQLLKTELAAEGALVAANPLLILVAWVLYSSRLSGDKSRVVLSLMLGAVLLSVFISTIKLARFELLPLIIGMATIKLLDQSRKGRAGGRRIWSIALYVGIAVAAFILFANIRGQSSGGNSIETTFTGYSVTSFNRLAALLDGQLVSSYGGTGTFVLNFLSNIPVIGSLAGLSLPDPATVFMQEFRDVGASGLDPGYIWLTMYGYYYADIGVWVFLYCFTFGFVTQMAWRSFNKLGVVGTAIYPYLASAMVLSFASYWISRPFIISIAIFLALYAICFAIAESSLKNDTHRNAGPRPINYTREVRRR